MRSMCGHDVWRPNEVPQGDACGGEGLSGVGAREAGLRIVLEVERVRFEGSCAPLGQMECASHRRPLDASQARHRAGKTA